MPPPVSPNPIKIVAAAFPEPSSRYAPIFVGKGGYGAILDATGGGTERHFYVPAMAGKALTVEDLEYLKVKGCFTLPEESEQLLEAYFRYFHPEFPVIDGVAFLQDYAVGGYEGINLLLLWSMFSIGASYVPALPRRARKESYIDRAKLLFDIGQETDKIVLVQSALLLSFWFADTEDVKQSWYWTSIAFSIAQTLGLHHSVRSTYSKISFRQQSLWRNIWRCCMIRDVWLAFGMGRPLRIEAADCDFPLSGDADCQFTELVLNGEKLYSLEEIAEFESAWQNFLATSDVLRGIMTSKTLSPTQAKPLRDCIVVQDICSPTFLLTHVERHLKLHQYAAIMALARACGLKEDLQIAADSTTAIIQAFLLDETILYVAPITIPLVIPAMVTYLAIMKSQGPKARNTGKANLSIYSRFFTAIKDNYPAASILERILAAAQEAVADQGSVREEEEAQLGFMDPLLTAWDPHWLGYESSSRLPTVDDLGISEMQHS